MARHSYRYSDNLSTVRQVSNMASADHYMDMNSLDPGHREIIEGEIADIELAKESLRAAHDQLRSFAKELEQREWDLDEQIRDRAEERAIQMYEDANEDLKLQLDHAERLTKVAKSKHEEALDFQKELIHRQQELQALEKSLLEREQALPGYDILKEVLLDLELDEDPQKIALLIRERFGLLIAQW